jgi:hypothetical protein
VSVLLLTAAIAATALGVSSIALVAVLSLRALRRDAEIEAEMRAAAFAFRLHLQPQRTRVTDTSDERADPPTDKLDAVSDGATEPPGSLQR